MTKRSHRDYYVAIRPIPGKKFAITRRSASANPHWKVSGNTVIFTPVSGPNLGKKLNFNIIDSGLSYDEGTVLKDFMIGAQLRMGRTQVDNGY